MMFTQKQISEMSFVQMKEIVKNNRSAKNLFSGKLSCKQDCANFLLKLEQAPVQQQQEEIKQIELDVEIVDEQQQPLIDLVKVMNQFPEYDESKIQGRGIVKKGSKGIAKQLKSAKPNVIKMQQQAKEVVRIKNIEKFVQSELPVSKIQLINNKVVIPNMYSIDSIMKNAQQNDGMFNPTVFASKKAALKRFVTSTFKIFKQNEQQLKRAGINTNVVRLQGLNGKSLDFVNSDDNEEQYNRAMTEEVFYNNRSKEGKLGNEVLVSLKNTIFISPMTKTRCVFDCIAVVTMYRQDIKTTNLYGNIKQTSEQLFKKYQKETGETTVNLEQFEILMAHHKIPIVKYNEKVEETIQQISVMNYQEHCIVVLPQNDENRLFALQIQIQYRQRVNVQLPVFYTKTQKIKMLQEDLEIQTKNLQLVQEKISQQTPTEDLRHLDPDFVVIQTTEEKQRDTINRNIKSINNRLKAFDKIRVPLYFCFDFEWCHEREALEKCAAYANKCKEAITQGKLINDPIEKQKFISEFIAQNRDKKDLTVRKYPYAYSITCLETGVYDDHDISLQCVQKFVSKVKQICDENQDRDIIFYAHNCFSADLPVVEKEMLKNFSKDNSDLQSRMAQVCVIFNRGKQLIKFQDTLKLIGPMTLEQVGDNYCKNYKKQDCDHSKIFLDNFEDQAEKQNLKSYIMSDVYVLKEALNTLRQQYIEDFDLDILDINNVLTVSSVSRNILFNPMFYDPKITPLYELPKIFEEFVRYGYGGGATQLFYKGHLYNIKAFSIDINSSYASVMAFQLFPAGPYFYKVFYNQKYDGRQLQQGMYKCFVESCDRTKIPFFQVRVDGKVTYPYLKNTIIVTTSVEIEYAYTQGAVIYLIDAILSETSVDLFSKFMDDQYSKRLHHKKLMNEARPAQEEAIKAEEEMEKLIQKAKESQDEELQQKYESLKKPLTELQEKCTSIVNQHSGQEKKLKTIMCSAYGKFGTQNDGIVSQITTNEDLISSMFLKGRLRDVQEISKNTYSFSGILPESTGNKTNYNNVMIAAFVTAYARILLHKIQTTVQECGFDLLYSDTDSVYFKAPQGASNKWINTQMDIVNEKWCHKTQIGKCKFEVADDVGDCLKTSKYKEETADEEEKLKYSFADEAVFLSLKTYALKSNYTGKEFIRANGIAKWMCDSTTDRYKWNHNDDTIGFQDFVNVNYGFQDSLTFNVIQFSTQKRFLADDTRDIINEGKFQTKSKECSYTQKIVTSTGECVPKVINKKDEFTPGFTIQETPNEYYICNTMQEIKDYFNVTDNIEWCLLREIMPIIRYEGTQQFYVFKNRECLVKFFDDKIAPQQEKKYHYVNNDQKQLVCADIDITMKEAEYAKKIEIDISASAFEAYLREAFRLSPDVECEIIDRTRSDKISYHIRFKNILSDRYTLKFLIDNCKGPLQEFVDTQIYKNSLRMTQISSEYIPNYKFLNYRPQLDVKEKKALETYIRQYTPKTDVQTREICGLDLQEVKKQADQLLVKLQLQNKLIFVRCKTIGRDTIVNLKHVKGMNIYCDKCQREHTNDNCFFIKISYNTARKVSECVLKCFKN